MRHQKTQPWAPPTETPDQWPQTVPTWCVQKEILDGIVEATAAAVVGDVAAETPVAAVVDGVGVAGVDDRDSPLVILLRSQKATPCCRQQEIQRLVRAAAVDAQKDWHHLC